MRAFDLDYNAYLQKGNRDLYGIRLIENKCCNVIDCCKILGPEHSILIDSRGLSGAASQQ
jgi:hypothetical protein